jgi:hypothetical protein
MPFRKKVPERRIVQMQQSGLDEALRATLGGMRAEYDRLAAEVKQHEQELARAREEMEHHRLLADAVGKELARRTGTDPGESAEDAGALDAQVSGLGQRSLPAADIAALRGSGTRIDAARRALRRHGAVRPVRARDAAEEYVPGGPIGKIEREGARHALMAMTANGEAVRLPDGSFLPIDSPLLAMMDGVPPMRYTGAETVGAH